MTSDDQLDCLVRAIERVWEDWIKERQDERVRKKLRITALRRFIKQKAQGTRHEI